MAANKNPDAEGLQPVENYNYPEVVPGQGYDTAPEAYSTIPQSYPTENKSTTHYFPNSTAPPGEWSHREQSPSPPQYFDHDRDETTKLEAQQKPRDRRICGMKRKVFVWVVIIAVIVILAAVLGGVLGSVLGKHDDNKSSNSNSTANSSTSGNVLLDKTGLAMLSPAGQSSTFYYYIDQHGNVVENEFTDGVTNQNTTPDRVTNVTSLSSAGSNTPIAAISYTLQQNFVRQLFFFNKDGHVVSTNTTGNEPWQAPYVTVGNQSCLPNTLALTAIADTNKNALNGIRVYFGSSAGYIQEIGMDFVDSAQNLWYAWNQFTGSSASSGVGSALVDGSSHVYFRNASTGVLQQWTWRYVEVNADSRWAPGASSTSSNGVLDGGSVAATSDGTNTDYIFYHDVSGQAVQALYTGGTSIGAPSTSAMDLGQSPEGYSFAATWVESTGAVVVNQPKGKTGLAFTSVSRDGQTMEWVKTT